MKIRIQHGSGRRKLAFVGGLALLACGSYLVGRYGNERLERWFTYATKGEIAWVDESALDFGETFVQDDFKWRVPIHNKSQRPLEIAGWRESCHCTAIEPDRLIIPSGEVREVAFTMNLTSAKAEADGQPAWDFAVMVSPKILTSSFPPAAWRIHGHVRAALVCLPGLLDFGESLVVGEPFKARSVEVSSHQRLESLKADWDRRLGAVAVRPVDAERRQFRVDVTPTKDLALGSHAFMVDLQGADSQGKVVAKGHISVQANVVDDMAIAPCPVSFGMGVVGQVLEQTVTLRSRMQRAFSLVRTHLGDENAASIELSELQPPSKDSCASYRIRLRPLQTGVHSLTILLQVQYTGAAPLDVPWSICYSASTADKAALSGPEAPSQRQPPDPAAQTGHIPIRAMP